ncbi:UPF0462 protein C4orf33 homolog [Liolophura sinensis]|uniref:UPF0462 protein C4orf33 homolog n=1 Tax=Liolophura sinensis TaxID=3198878 RepID=UPI003158640F
MEFKIQTLWDGGSIDHDPVVIKLEGSPSGLIMTVDAPFFDDPKPMGGVAGQPYPELWNYEVVEAFFLNDKNEYLEMEFSPHGQHLLLLLDGYRHPIQDKLPLEYQATIEDKKWQGRAVIPAGYFPSQVSKMNCYSIHGVGDKRTYESLYPTPKGKYSEPDFHRLEYFQPINLKALLPDNTEPDPKYWKKK